MFATPHRFAVLALVLSLVSVPAALAGPNPPPAAERPMFVLVSMDATPKDRDLEDESFYKFFQRVRKTGDGATFTLFINTGFMQLDPRKAVVASWNPFKGTLTVDGQTLGPNRPVIKYAQSPESIRRMAANVLSLHNLGVEIGSHTVRHDHGASWTEAKWRAEFADHQRVLDLLGLPRPAGIRAPFLENNEALFKVMAEHQMTYDTSKAETPARAWPKRLPGTGIWEFGIPSVRFPDGSNAGMFFDLRIKKLLRARGCTTPAQLDQAYHEMAMMEFERRYTTSRAPLLLTGHGNFMGGIARTMEAVCSRPMVRCATFAEAAEYLRAHPELEGAR